MCLCVFVHDLVRKWVSPFRPHARGAGQGERYDRSQDHQDRRGRQLAASAEPEGRARRISTRGASTRPVSGPSRMPQSQAAVRLQESAGLDVISDGEMRRLNFQDSFGAAVEGYRRQALHAQGLRAPRGGLGAAAALGHPADARCRAPRCRIAARRRRGSRSARNVPLEEYQVRQQASRRRPAKVSLIGPDRISQRFDYQASSAVYRDLDDFVADVVAIERAIVESLVDGRLSLHPYRCAGLHGLCRRAVAGADARARRGPERNFARSLKAEAAVVAGSRRDVTTGIHLCRGNQRSMWHREGSLRRDRRAAVQRAAA